MQSLRQPFPAHYLLGQEINSSTQAVTTEPSALATHTSTAWLNFAQMRAM